MTKSLDKHVFAAINNNKVSKLSINFERNMFSMEFKNEDHVFPEPLIEALQDNKGPLSFSFNIDVLNTRLSGWEGDQNYTKARFYVDGMDLGLLSLSAFSHNREDKPEVPEIKSVFVSGYYDTFLDIDYGASAMDMKMQEMKARVNNFNNIRKTHKDCGTRLIITSENRNAKKFQTADDIWSKDFYNYGGYSIGVLCHQVLIRREDLGLECYVKDKYYPERIGKVSEIKED